MNGRIFTFSILLFALSYLSFSQSVYTDHKPVYSKVAANIQIEKIEYTEQHTILTIKYTAAENIGITFYGSLSGDSWCLNNPKMPDESYQLIMLQNLTKNGKLIDDALGRQQMSFQQAQKGDVFVCNAVFEKLTDNLSAMNLIKGYLPRSDNFVFKNILFKPEYGIPYVNHYSDKGGTDSVKLLEKLNQPEKLADYLQRTALIQLENGKYSAAIVSLNKAVGINKEQNRLKELVASNISLGQAYYYANNLNMAISGFKEALDNAQKLNSPEDIAIIQNNLATVFDVQMNYSDAVNYYELASNTRLKMNDKEAYAGLQNKIGNIYFEINDFEKTLSYYSNSLSTEKELGNQKEIAASLNNIGVVYLQKNEFDKAIGYFQEALKINEKQRNTKEIAGLLNNIGNVNFESKNYTQSIEYYNKSIGENTKINYFKGLSITRHNLGNAYSELKQTDKAREAYQQSIEFAIKADYTPVLYANYRALAELETEKNCAQALDFYKKYTHLRFNDEEEKQRQISELHEKYVIQSNFKQQKLLLHIDDLNRKIEITGKELSRSKEQYRVQKLVSKYRFEQSRKEIELLNTENKLAAGELLMADEKAKKQNLIIIGVVLLVLLISTFTTALYKQFAQKKKANATLLLQNAEIRKQREEIKEQRDEANKQKVLIEEQNRNITDSIKYASRIQSALLPPAEQMQRVLPNHFVFYKPRDIVSGDFFWLNKQENMVTLAVADCTGHGVPGALMSMLGVSMLNEIVSKDVPQNAASVLNKLRDSLIEALHQTGKAKEAKDGIDMSLAIFDFDNLKLHFAGAYNPIYITRSTPATNETSLFELKADRMPIGIYYKETAPFRSRIFDLKKGDMVYLFTDGYTDQFGSSSGRKFLSGNFKRLLTDIHQQSAEMQKQSLIDQFYNWKGDYEQVDDVLVVGVRI